MKYCYLCKNLAKLQQSHIIPNFTIKDTKEKSLLKSFITYESQGKPVQQTKLFELLCRNCEQLFSKYEKGFAERIYVPVSKGFKLDDTVFQNDVLFKKIAISFAWRVLQVLFLSKENIHEISLTELKEIDLGYRNYLLDEIEYCFPSPKWYSFFMENFDPSDKAILNEVNCKPDFYNTFLISTSGYLILPDHENNPMVFFKLPGLLLLMPLKTQKTPMKWVYVESLLEGVCQFVNDNINMHTTDSVRFNRSQKILKDYSENDRVAYGDTIFGSALYTDLVRQNRDF